MSTTIYRVTVSDGYSSHERDVELLFSSLENAYSTNLFNASCKACGFNSLKDLPWKHTRETPTNVWCRVALLPENRTYHSPFEYYIQIEEVELDPPGFKEY